MEDFRQFYATIKMHVFSLKFAEWKMKYIYHQYIVVSLPEDTWIINNKLHLSSEVWAA